MKKWVGVFIVLFSFVFCLPTVVYAASEKESNDSMNEATFLPLGSEVTGALGDRYDEDFYRFELNTPGYVRIHFEHEWVDVEEGCQCWFMYVYDSYGENVCSAYNVGWGWEGADDGGCTAELGLGKGTYYICVLMDEVYSGEEYSLMVEYIESTEWESEHNNGIYYADEISLGQEVYGYSMYEDEDWFSFTLEKSSKIEVEFIHDILDDYYTHWIVYIYDDWGNSKEYTMYVQGNQEVTLSDEITLSAGTYYAVVVPYDTNTDTEYCIEVRECHNCTGTWAVTKNASCLENGKKEQICTTCGKVMSTISIPATGHGYNDPVISRKPTCTEYGSQYAYCMLCGHKKTETVSKLDHAYGDWQITEEPTCIATGTEEQSCVDCGKSQSRTVEKLTYHQYGDWAVFEEATCEKDGTEKRSCIFCEHVETRAIARLEHQYGEWKIVKGNMIIPPIVEEKVCSICEDAQQSYDWSYVWIPVTIFVVVIATLSGVVSVMIHKKK